MGEESLWGAFEAAARAAQHFWSINETGTQLSHLLVFILVALCFHLAQLFHFLLRSRQQRVMWCLMRCPYLLFSDPPTVRSDFIHSAAADASSSLLTSVTADDDDASGGTGRLDTW